MADTVEGKVHVVNTALSTHLGLPASYSIDDESTLGGQVDLAWNTVLAEVMMVHAWSVFQDEREALPIVDAPRNGWLFVFELPADRIGLPIAVLIDVVRETYLREFKVMGGKLYTNISPVWVRIRVMQDPEYWDMAFRAAFSVALASALAVPLRQDEDERDKLHMKAYGDPRENGGGGLFGKLITLDRSAQPQGRGFLNNDPLTRARR
jgi:hypothetical protein